MSKGLDILQELRNKSGLELYESGMVSPHRNYFKVHSLTDPDMYYEVNENVCSCPDYEKRGKYLRCKHLVSVELYIKNTPLLLVQ